MHASGVDNLKIELFESIQILTAAETKTLNLHSERKMNSSLHFVFLLKILLQNC